MPDDTDSPPEALSMDHLRAAALARDHIQQLRAEADRERQVRQAGRPDHRSSWLLDAVRGTRRPARELEPEPC